MLQNFISVIVPQTKDVNQAITPAEHLAAVRDVARQFSVVCGGASAERVLGFWVSDSIGLVEENTTRVTSYYDTSTLTPEQAIELLRSVALNLKAQFSQEAVLIQTEQGIDFI